MMWGAELFWVGSRPQNFIQYMLMIALRLIYGLEQRMRIQNLQQAGIKKLDQFNQHLSCPDQMNEIAGHGSVRQVRLRDIGKQGQVHKCPVCNISTANCILVVFVVMLGMIIIHLALNIENQTSIIQQKTKAISLYARQVTQLQQQISLFCSQSTRHFDTWANTQRNLGSAQVQTPKPIEYQVDDKALFHHSQNVMSYLAHNYSKFQIYTQLFLNWEQEDQLLDEVEYYLLNQSYHLDVPAQQRRFCIMSPFKNLLKYGKQNSSLHFFMKSVNGQNYSNFHVYLIDDASTDGSADQIMKELPKYPRLSNRATLIKNTISVGALANRDYITRKYCRPGDIVMDIDGDDALIGKQVFNFFNRFYNAHNDAWFVYSNFIQVVGKNEGDGRKILMNISSAQIGPSKKIKSQIHLSNTYRTNLDWWCTSELRTYLFDLYIKIPISYFVDKDFGQYYLRASDRFVMYAITELAGPKHTFYLDEYPYFYFQPNYRALEHYECSFAIIQFYQAKSRVQTPFLPLQSLEDEAELTKNYEVPFEIVKYRLQKQLDLLSCKQSILIQQQPGGQQSQI